MANVLAIAWFNAANNLPLQCRVPVPARRDLRLGRARRQRRAPAGAAYAVLYLPSMGDTGSVWFDDASARPA